MADNLWALREQKKLSVAALANRAGLPIGLIIEYESGQRSIDPRHIGRIARALYIEESDIRLQSDRRPAAAGATAPPRREPEREVAPLATGARPQRPHDKTPRPTPAPKPPPPAKPSQITFIEGLLHRLHRTPEELAQELGKPLAELNRPGASEVIKKLQAEVAQSAPADRHRAYLPEAVDSYEERYLTAAREAGDWLTFTLFDSSIKTGQIIGFGAYSLTIREADGSELSLNKLALVSYRKEPKR